jgi:hypothetical protein
MGGEQTFVTSWLMRSGHPIVQIIDVTAVSNVFVMSRSEQPLIRRPMESRQSQQHSKTVLLRRLTFAH